MNNRLAMLLSSLLLLVACAADVADVEASAQAVVDPPSTLLYSSTFNSSFPMPFATPIPVGSFTFSPQDGMGVNHPINWAVFRAVCSVPACADSGGMTVAASYTIASGPATMPAHDVYQNTVDCLEGDPSGSTCVAVSLHFTAVDPLNDLSGLPTYFWSRVNVSTAIASSSSYVAGSTIKVSPIDVLAHDIPTMQTNATGTTTITKQ